MVKLRPFEELNPKVRDHCHYTGKYRGPTHRTWSCRYKIPSYIPVISHNLSGYDAQLFIKELGKGTNNIGVIAKNKEDYITFSVDVVVGKYVDEKEKIQLRFIDRAKFMSTSLESLTNNLVGVSEIKCNLCKGDWDLACIDECYVAHAKCRKCYAGYSKRQLNKKLIFDNFLNLRLSHTDEQLDYYLLREFIHMSTCRVGISLMKLTYPKRKVFIASLT